MEDTIVKPLTPSEMGKKSFEARKKKYGEKVMANVRKGKKFAKK